MKTLQSLQGQSFSFYILILPLNPARDSITNISEWIISQILLQIRPRFGSVVTTVD